MTIPDPGIYAVAIAAHFGGASGSGSVAAGVDRLSPSGGASMTNQIWQDGPFNGHVAAADVFLINAAERIQWWVSASATGTGHNLTRFQIGIARLA